MTERGFTLLELLIIISIVSLLVITFSVYSLRSLRNAELREVATQMATTLSRARSEAQKTSKDVLVEWTPGPEGKTTVYKVNGVLHQLDKGVVFQCVTNCDLSQLIYTAPYGELRSATGKILLLSSPHAGIVPFELRTVGVTGKVILARMVQP